MHPTLAEGAWLVQRTAKVRFDVGYVYALSPRSTTNWYASENSIGIYPAGVDVYGKPSRHTGKTTSAGIALLGIQWNTQKRITVTGWDMLTANVSNTALLQIEHGNKEDRWMAGAMVIRQDRIASGGNRNDSLAYFQSAGSLVFSGRLRMNMGRFRWQANYTRITADGRYLMPREWGREPFGRERWRGRRRGGWRRRRLGRGFRPFPSEGPEGTRGRGHEGT